MSSSPDLVLLLVVVVLLLLALVLLLVPVISPVTVTIFHWRCLVRAVDGEVAGLAALVAVVVVVVLLAMHAVVVDAHELLSDQGKHIVINTCKILIRNR